MLLAGDRALLLGATVVAIRGNVVSQVINTEATGTWAMRFAIYLADIAQSVFPAIEVVATEASYLWFDFDFFGGATTYTTPYHRNVELDIKAKRKFRENNKTLWFISQHSETGTAGTLHVRVHARTLLYVP